MVGALGFNSRSWRHSLVEFVVGSRPCSEGFSPGTPVFHTPQKLTFPNSNSTWIQWTNSHSVDAPHAVLQFSLLLKNNLSNYFSIMKPSMWHIHDCGSVLQNYLHPVTASYDLIILFYFISFHFISFHFISFHFISFHFISFHFILFYFILFYFIVSYLTLFYFILCYFILFYFIVSYLIFILFYVMLLYFILFYFISFHFISFHFIAFHFILFYFILFYFILFYFILFYFILFYFILFYFILFYFAHLVKFNLTQCKYFLETRLR